MLQKKYALFLFLLLILSAGNGRAQNKNADSLRIYINAAKNDSNKVNALISLAREFTNIKPDTFFVLSTEALVLAEKIKWEKGIGNAEHNLGSFYFFTGDYAPALIHYFKALTIREKQNDKAAITKTLGNIGVIYRKQGNFSKALDYHFKALKMDEELGRKSGIAVNLGNIGNIYLEQSDYANALTYYFKALEMDEELGNKSGIARHHSNIGSVYSKQGEKNAALEYYFKSLKLNEELGNKNGIAISCLNIGAVLLEKKKYDQAKEYLTKALLQAKSIGSKAQLQNVYKNLSSLDSATGNYKGAFDNYKNSIRYRDSITNEEMQKKSVETAMQYEFDKKQVADSIRNAEQLKVESVKHDQEIKHQRLYTYGGIVGFLLMIIVAAVSFRAYIQKQKSNRIITKQKQLVEDKQKEVLDSIHYAQRIQQSLLPTEKYIDKTLKKLMKK